MAFPSTSTFPTFYPLSELWPIIDLLLQPTTSRVSKKLSGLPSIHSALLTVSCPRSFWILLILKECRLLFTRCFSTMAAAEMPSGIRSARLADDGKEMITDPLEPLCALTADFPLCLKQLPLLRYMLCTLNARRPSAISLRLCLRLRLMPIT